MWKALDILELREVAVKVRMCECMCVYIFILYYAHVCGVTLLCVKGKTVR